MWGIFPSFVYTGLLVRVFPHLHRLNVTHYSKSSPLHAVCSLFICMTDPSQICPSPILLELLELFQDVNCNNERLKGGTLKPLITEFLLHGKPFFFFLNILKRRSFQKYCAGIWSFLHYRERWYFFFPKIWSYTLDGKWKMIFLKKIHGNMIFSSNFLKRWSFQKGPRRHMIFLVLSGKMVFFSRKHDLFSLGRKWKTVFLRKYMETWCIAQRRKTGNLIYRVEVWPLLKFIRLEIFHNE